MDILKIKELNDKLEVAKTQLKTEFFGIDDIIDSIINNIKPWLYFPETLSRPTIINLWGLTGVGKTSVVNRVIELLDLKQQAVSFNFAEIDEKSNWEVQEDLNDHVVSMDIKNPVFIYDEFQYAKTIDENGKECNKPALKIFWELLDTGTYKINYDFSDKWNIKNMIRYFKKTLNNDNIVIENGQITKGEKEYIQVTRFANNSSTSWDSIDPELAVLEKPTVFNESQKSSIFDILKITDPNNYSELLDVYKKLATLNKQEIYEFLKEIQKRMLENITVDFSKSLIFVLGNLDEAYKMVYDSDPDMDADQFHEASKKISIVKIKNALQARFRVEQIARLGNTHLIYPSFSKDTFRKIIRKQLDDYCEEVKKNFNIALQITDSIVEIIYKDSVFPTHGTRPIFTSIFELVKSKLSDVLLYAYNNNIKFNALQYEFKDAFEAKYFNENSETTKSVKIPLNLRVEKFRKPISGDQQIITAVHEAGHAVIYIDLNKTLPVKICSTSTIEGFGGFMLDSEEEKIHSLNYIKNTLAVDLGGRVAEQFVFETDKLVTIGASADIEAATVFATNAIRKWGLGNTIAKTGWMQDPSGSDNKIYSKTEDILIEEWLQESSKIARESLKQQEKLFLKIAEYLTSHSEMNQETLADFVSKYYVGELIVNKTLYKDILQKKLDAFN